MGGKLLSFCPLHHCIAPATPIPPPPAHIIALLLPESPPFPAIIPSIPGLTPFPFTEADSCYIHGGGVVFLPTCS